MRSSKHVGSISLLIKPVQIVYISYVFARLQSFLHPWVHFYYKYVILDEEVRGSPMSLVINVHNHQCHQS